MRDMKIFAHNTLSIDFVLYVWLKQDEVSQLFQWKWLNTTVSQNYYYFITVWEIFSNVPLFWNLSLRNLSSITNCRWPGLFELKNATRNSSGTQVLQTRVPCKYGFCIHTSSFVKNILTVWHWKSIYRGSSQSTQKRRCRFIWKTRNRASTNHTVYTMPSQPIIQKSEKNGVGQYPLSLHRHCLSWHDFTKLALL